MMDKNYFAPVSKGAAKKNALIRAYPDGTFRVTCFSRPTYTANGLERSDKEEAAERRQKLKALHGGAEKSDTPREDRERSDNEHRARNAIFDIAACNDWQYFVTLTLDAEQIDRYDPAQIVRPVVKWFDNMVQRRGLRYLIVPEHHRDGAIHFHGLIAGDDLRLSDSGTVKVPGRKKPVKRATAKRNKVPEDQQHTVYNWDDFKLGFSTAIAIYGERGTLAKYMTKYITKDLGKIFGHRYFAGGKGLRRKPRSGALDLNFDRIPEQSHALPFELGYVKYVTLPSKEALNDFLLEVSPGLTRDEARGIFS